MRSFLHQLPTALCASALALTAAAAQNNSNSEPGAVIQSVPPPVSQKQQLPPLNLTKPAQSFDPMVGAKIPTGLKAHSLPPPLIYEMPALKRYTYLKFKGQVLIVNPMTGKIVDMFSET